MNEPDSHLVTRTCAATLAGNHEREAVGATGVADMLKYSGDGGPVVSGLSVDGRAECWRRGTSNKRDVGGRPVAGAGPCRHVPPGDNSSEAMVVSN